METHRKNNGIPSEYAILQVWQRINKSLGHVTWIVVFTSYPYEMDHLSVLNGAGENIVVMRVRLQIAGTGDKCVQRAEHTVRSSAVCCADFTGTEGDDLTTERIGAQNAIICYTGIVH